MQAFISLSVKLACFGCLGGAWLLLTTTPALAAEQLCSDLGSDCVCSEPMNTGTFDGGKSILVACPNSSGTCHANPDDSDSATECGGENNSGAALTFNRFQNILVEPVSSAGQPLPSGHSLAFVFQHTGSGGAHIAAGNISFPGTGQTLCARTYQRWHPSAPNPPSSQNNDQYKVQTIGGMTPDGNSATFQISVKGGGAGNIHTRQDGQFYNCPFDAPEQFLGSIDECRNNYCRFETCLDLDNSGILRTRFRKTVVSPGSGTIYTIHRTQCQNSQNILEFVAGGSNSRIVGWFNSGVGEPTRYATHAIMTHKGSLSTSFWPGPAAEVEGGVGLQPPILLEE